MLASARSALCTRNKKLESTIGTEQREVRSTIGTEQREVRTSTELPTGLPMLHEFRELKQSGFGLLADDGPILNYNSGGFPFSCTPVLKVASVSDVSISDN